MPNFSSKILGNSVSALVAQQALIANTSNNIANVNTPGYTRRELSILNRSDAATIHSAFSFGSGVEVGAIRRITSDFLEGALRDAVGRQGQANVMNDYLGHIEPLFSLTGPQQTIGSTLNEFFAAINRIAVNPSSIDDRLSLMQRGEELVNAIKLTYNTIAATQTELDTRVPLEVKQVNDYTAQIAALNDIIGRRQASGVPAIDEYDQRDALLLKLSEKISFQKVELENGVVNISLANGFPLVNGSASRELSTTASPSFGGTVLPPSLEGRTLCYVVYNFGTDEAPSHLDLTKVIKNGQGALGGVLQLRGYANVSNTSAFEADGELVAIASRVEALTRSLLTAVNETYLGPDENSNAPGLQPSAGDLNGDPPGVFGLFDFDFEGEKDGDIDGRPESTDLDLLGQIIPNFSSRIKLGFTAPEKFAAARDNDGAQGVKAFPTGDGENAAVLAALKAAALPFSSGGFSFNGTFDELYSSTVNYVGGRKATAETDVAVANATQVSAQAKRDELSSVSLDEEFANLIKYEKAFQASARIIRTANDMLEQIVGLL